MSKTLVRIIAQFHNRDGKPKGGQEFTVNIDLDDLMYDEKTVIEVIKTMLADLDKEKGWGKHEYVDHEVIFHEPIALNSEVFEKKLIEKLRANFEAKEQG